MHPPGLQRDGQRLWMAHLTRRVESDRGSTGENPADPGRCPTQIQSLHRDEVERGSQIFKAANDQIAALLTPDQKVELQKMESEREKMFSGHMRPWGGSRDGPAVRVMAARWPHHDGAAAATASARIRRQRAVPTPPDRCSRNAEVSHERPKRSQAQACGLLQRSAIRSRRRCETSALNIERELPRILVGFEVPIGGENPHGVGAEEEHGEARRAAG